MRQLDTRSPTAGQPLQFKRHWIWVTVVALLPPLVVLTWVPPLAQDPAYHDFADQRSLLGIPHFGNVISNLPFVAVGAYGFWYTAARSSHDSAVLPGERYAQLIFFAGIALTGLGSTWYHLQPDNLSLVWDRAPMTLGFMALFGMMISERVSPKLGIGLLLPLCLIGLLSVYWWAIRDDLRAYAIVQFYPILVMIFILWQLPSRYTHGNWYWGVLAWYAVAKVCEALDARLFEVLQWVSGHSLKHVFAAVSAWWLLRMLKIRRTL
ncbi:MAG: ceramidase [Gammaproteobacteria bacterium]|nr:ceramidase [Gammaproteobacteria bacterium]